MAVKSTPKGRGGWVSYSIHGGVIDGQEIGFHSAEIGALRRAVKIGGESIYVEYGQTLGEAIAGKPAEQRMPGEEPLPLDEEARLTFTKGGEIVITDEPVISKGKAKA